MDVLKKTQSLQNPEEKTREPSFSRKAYILHLFWLDNSIMQAHECKHLHQLQQIVQPL